jgi:hypothetical protein
MTFIATTDQDEVIMDPIRRCHPAHDPEQRVGLYRRRQAERSVHSRRAVYVENFRNKPPHTTFEGWQTTLPIILNEKGRAVIRAIS